MHHPLPLNLILSSVVLPHLILSNSVIVARCFLNLEDLVKKSEKWLNNPSIHPFSTA